jgi:hypothetical protein
LVPTSNQAFPVDTSLERFFLFEQIHSDMAENCKILWAMIFSEAMTVFIKSDIENPMRVVFDNPMRSVGAQGPFGTANYLGGSASRLVNNPFVFKAFTECYT